MILAVVITIAILRSKYLCGLRGSNSSPPLDPIDESYLSCSWTKCQNKNKTIAPVKYENENKH
jgi:hypothetical protein